MDKKEEESKVINGNVILLSFEGFIKYIEGLNRGIQAASSVNSQVVTECIGEVLEYLTTSKNDIKALLLACEEVLKENETLTEMVATLKKEQTELELETAKLKAEMAVEND